MIPAVVLAAGQSSRMGRPKALMPIGRKGETFLTRIVGVLRESGVSNCFVVVGGDAAAVRTSLTQADPFVQVVENHRHEEGQLSSLLAGLDAVERVVPAAEAALVTLVDVPLITVETVRAVLDAYRAASNAAIVRPSRGPRRGHPVVFARRLFEEFRRADPAAGAKPVVRAHSAEEANVEMSDDGAFTDIDTPEDWERFVAPTLKGASSSLRNE